MNETQYPKIKTIEHGVSILNSLLCDYEILPSKEDTHIHFKWRHKYYLLEFFGASLYGSTEHGGVLYGSANDAILFQKLIHLSLS